MTLGLLSDAMSQIVWFMLDVTDSYCYRLGLKIDLLFLHRQR